MLSVIIPTCNRIELLSNCLLCLSPVQQGILADGFEVIVTDDSFDNTTKDFITAKFPWVKWMRGPQRGPAANRNYGAKHASGEWLVFLDDDCLPLKNWLSSYTNVIAKNHDILVFEGQTIADRPKERFDEEAPINDTGDKLWSCNFAISNSFFVYLGGFDETFPYAAMEDVDFYTRVKGFTEIHFVPEAIVIHPWRRVRSFQTFRKHLKSHAYFAKKYRFKGTTRFRWERTKIFIGTIVFEFVELVKFSMKGWPFYVEKCFLNFCLIFI